MIQRDFLNTDLNYIAERISPSNSSLSLTFVKGTTAIITTTDITTVIAAVGLGVKLYITDILITCGHATIGTYVQLLDGDATIIWEGFAGANGGGFVGQLKTPLVLTANTALKCKCVTDASSVIVNASGYKGI